MPDPNEGNPFEPPETPEQQGRRIGRMIRRNVDERLALAAQVDPDTLDNPEAAFRDETERQFCPKCRNYFRLGFGMMPDERVMAITRRHMELCEGDAAATLEKIKAELAGR